jgi:ketopantoate hydroxymethyltransferase
MAGAGTPLNALKAYVQAVKSRAYPGPEHGF